MKNGFTLVELLAVIVLMAIIGAVGLFGVSAVNKNIKNNMLESKLELIKKGAERFGSDNLYLLSGTCENGKSSCFETTVQNLIDNNYVSSEEKDAAGNIIILNNLTEESLNNEIVYIYLEYNNVYVEFKNTIV